MTKLRSIAVALAVLGSLAIVAQPASAHTRHGGVSFAFPTTVDPAHSGIVDVSCTSPTSCVAVDGSGSAMVLRGTTWSHPRGFDALPGGKFVEAVSCAKATFCIAVDSLGRASRFDGTSWSPPDPIDPGHALLDISCPTPTFCAATDHEGRATVFDGSGWSTPTFVDGDRAPMYAVSCATATFCMALDFGQPVNGVQVAEKTFSYDGRSWTTAAGTAPMQATTISCVSPMFCMAASGKSEATFDGTTWSAPVDVTDSYTLGNVSCASPSFCMIGDRSGNAYRYDGANWSTPQPVLADDWLRSISCVSTSHCVAIGAHGHAPTYDTGSWSDSILIDQVQGDLGNVSCPTASFCLATDDNGRQLTLRGEAWSPPRPIRSQVVAGFAVSCTSPTFCAGAEADSVYTYDGRSWSDGQKLLDDPDAYLDAVSCTSPRFCLAVGSSGNAAVYDGSTWSTIPYPSTTDSADSLSCASASYCVAVVGPADEAPHGSSLVYDGRSWSRTPSPPPISGYSYDVSCTSGTFCMVTTAAGRSAVFTGSAWKATGRLAAGQAVSCSSSRFCVSVGGAGHIAYFDGTQWSAHLVAGAPSYADVSCATRSRCVAVGAGMATIGGHSSAFTVKAPAKIGHHHHARIEATLVDPSTGRAIGHARLELRARTSTSHHFALVGKATTDRHGRASRRVSARHTSTYEWLYAGHRHHQPSVSAAVRVRVRR